MGRIITAYSQVSIHGPITDNTVLRDGYTYIDPDMPDIIPEFPPLTLLSYGCEFSFKDFSDYDTLTYDKVLNSILGDSQPYQDFMDYLSRDECPVGTAICKQAARAMLHRYTDILIALDPDQDLIDRFGLFLTCALLASHSGFCENSW